LSSGVISYRSKTQSLTATSSIEAKFIADAVSSGKVANYLCSIHPFPTWFSQSTPTPICEDKESAINMTNNAD
jgi:hypothetical protein